MRKTRSAAALHFGQDAEDSIGFELRIKRGQRHYKRRITDDPRSALYDLRQLRKGVLVVAIARLGQVLGEPFVLCWLQLALDLRQKVVEIDMGIPDVNRRHRRESVHRHPVLGDGGCRDGLSDGSRVVVDAPRDGKAGDQSLDVPLPWARERLVEVVDVEHHSSLWRCVRAEVGEVRVAATLHPDPRVWRRRQVGCHHKRRAPKEREGRCEHPAVPDCDQFRNSRRSLLLKQRNRIGTARRWGKRGVTRAGNPGACCPPASDPFLDGEPRR